MAQVRKKYNHAAAQAKARQRATAKASAIQAKRLQIADAKIREALKGATVAYNSTWGHTEHSNGELTQKIETSGSQALCDLLGGDTTTAFGVILEIVIRWRIYITIYNVTEDGEEYLILLPVIDRADSMINIIHEIQGDLIPRALKKRVQAHLKDWGYWGEIF